MSSTAANLIERVLPPSTPLRQWVLTFPFPWRPRLAQDGELLGRLTQIFVATVQAFYVRRAVRPHAAGAKTGAVTAVQRTSSDLRLNPHLHTIALERVEQRHDGLVRITLKEAYADGTIAVDMDPLSLLCRLATSASTTTPHDPLCGSPAAMRQRSRELTGKLPLLHLRSLSPSPRALTYTRDRGSASVVKVATSVEDTYMPLCALVVGWRSARASRGLR